jgi:hypothetical protein
VADDDLTEAERRMRDRQDGDYQPPILVEPEGGPIPEWAPESDDEDTD